MFDSHKPCCFDSASARRRRLGHRGSVTLEFIVALPILIIALFAIIEYGLFFANMQQVALACRVGAKAASLTDELPPAPDSVPTQIVDAIGQQLGCSGIAPSAIFLEHDVFGSEQELVTTFDSDCACAPPSSPLPSPPGGARSVRITVCVPMGQLAPNCLAVFGFDLAHTMVKSTTTFRYRGSPPCQPAHEKPPQT